MLLATAPIQKGSHNAGCAGGGAAGVGRINWFSVFQGADQGGGGRVTRHMASSLFLKPTTARSLSPCSRRGKIFSALTPPHSPPPSLPSLPLLFLPVLFPTATRKGRGDPAVAPGGHACKSWVAGREEARRARHLDKRGRGCVRCALQCSAAARCCQSLPFLRAVCMC